MPHAHDADPGPGLAGISIDCPVWLPESSLGAHWLLLYVPPRFGSYSHRRQMSLNKSHHFSQTRIQVAEGQPSPNTSYTFPNIKATVRVPIREQETEDQRRQRLVPGDGGEPATGHMEGPLIPEMGCGRRCRTKLRHWRGLDHSHGRKCQRPCH